MNIKMSLNNPYHLASWVPNTDCCEWYVVKCDRNTNRIIELTVFQGKISGQIPSSVGDLPYLETVVFKHLTNVTCTIPRSITMLKLSQVGSQLTNLKYFDLSFNQFSGSIPPSLSEHKNLESIDLSRNRLTGSIPESFGRFPGPVIPHLFLSHNQLSGPIPKSLGALDYGTIDFSNHGLTTFIDLSRNQFEFDLTKVKFPKSLTWLDLSHNKIFGRIPEEIKGLELQMLNVSYNSLCGKIPYGGKMQSFDKTEYFHNKCLCGPPMAGCKKVNA
ncbi:hypothetical protein MKW98_015816 [Papaver atlanticum]|uniref:Leucine-rich repeat-containing N-terminal plant-type domain-containing protein n=1 Tax=Papaver atlanticum TaxID=357466 RepID=A0AAD4TB12_9MAGN|nr:hypothetical protein MKW98_015816 [Papaver atlanticum]